MEKRKRKTLYFIIGVLSICLIAGSYVCVKQNKRIHKESLEGLLDTFNYMTDQQHGITSWTTEEEWNWNMEALKKYLPIYELPKSGDTEELYNFIILVSEISWDSPVRSELAEGISGIKINWTFKASSYSTDIISENYEEIFKKVKGESE